MENDPYQLNEVYENTFKSIFLINQTPFIMKKVFNTISTFIKNWN